MVLLHGYLDVQILSGADLGKKKPSSFFGRLSNLALQSGIDPYVSVALGGKNKYFQSRVVNNSSDPVWESSVLLNVCHELDFLELRVKGAPRPGLGLARKLGRVELPADELVSSGQIEGTFNLIPYGGSDDEDAEEGELGSVTVKMRLLPLDAYVDRLDVPGTYFPLRTGCQVRLYQDAHVDENELPEVPGSSYVPGCCFRDMYAAIDAAQNFVYITGWSVFTEISLLRERHGGGEDPETLGMLLKRKAEEGVQVRIMVWDELMSTSGSVLGHDFEHKGLMMTHDEETREYFEGVSNVVVIKASRKNDSDGPLADFGSTAMFTHHQKTIICDAESDTGGDKRRLISFVGGLDLTNGRFDTPTHSLFRTLASTHRPPDFHQACVTVSATKGPREPWHDQAGQISAGAASWDVLRNFTERWRRQAGSEEHALVDISRREYVSAEEEEENGRRRRGAWNVQILRSINEASAVFHDARSPGLFTRRRALIDQSIHHAYVHHVRRSKRFCFFENQYWLGSSTHWLENKNESADHLLPVEIAMRVARAVKEQEPYHAYIMIPLFPEGPPASGSVQEILAFQFQTFCMMYKIIADAISEAGTDEEPIDRLSFYFSAIRETERDSEAVDDGEFENETEELLSRTRRHSVYCHSKAVIFDDAITIIGSANCNSRSMDGARDSEIAFAAYQPEHVCGGGRSGNPGSSRRDLPPAYSEGESSSRSRGLPEGTTTRSRGFVYGGTEHDDGDDDGQSRRRHGHYGGGRRRGDNDGSGSDGHGSDDDEGRRRRHGRYGGGRRYGNDDGSGSDGHGSDDDEGRRRRHGRYGGGRRYGNDSNGSDHDGRGSGSDDDGGRRRRHGRRHGSGSDSDDDRRRRHGRYGQCDDGEQHSHSGGYGQQHSHSGGYGQQQSYSGGYGQQQSHSGGYGQQQSYSGGYGQQQSHSSGYGQHHQTPGYEEAQHGYSGYQPSNPYGTSGGMTQSGGGYGQPPDESSGYGQHQQSDYGQHQQSSYGQYQQSSYGGGGGGGGGYQQPSHTGGYGQEHESYGGGGYQQHQQGSYGGGGGYHQSSHGGGYGHHQQSSYGGGGSGGYQTHQQHGSYTGGGGGGASGLPRGDVASFRLNLFGEHLNCYDPVFDDPSSLECVRKVREIAEANWEAYSGDEVVEMHGWCPYPIEVSRSGRVSTRIECFPDTDAKVAGADGALPDILTT